MDVELVPPPPPVVEIVPEAHSSDEAGPSSYKPTTTPSASVLSVRTPGPVAGLASSRASSSAVAGPVAGPSYPTPFSSAVAGPVTDPSSSQPTSSAARPSVAAGPASGSDSQSEAGSSVTHFAPSQESECEAEEEDDQTQFGGTSTQYFTARFPKTNRYRWLVLFHSFLSRPSAGDKKPSVKLQHAAQMRGLLEAIDPAGDDITCLLENEGDTVWHKWVKPHLQNITRKPGTLISYLTLYEKFLTFVKHERFNKAAPPLHPDHTQTFQNVLKDLKGWRSCVDSQ